MKYNFQIKYNIQYDVWNWIDALTNPFMGLNWIDNIDNKKDLKIAKQILKLENKKTQAKKILKIHLQNQKDNSKSKLNKFIPIAQKDFENKYQDACKTLERITQQPLMSNKFIFYITTFPRCPYFYETREIYMYNSTDDFWGLPIDNFLHEGLHFQFTHYWYENKKSLVSKLKNNDFDYLKEALTIVLDDELKPVLSKPDQGYSNQVGYRKLLHKHWQKYHNFDELVNLGLSKLDDFKK
jgi:hypothetical protein